MDPSTPPPSPAKQNGDSGVYVDPTALLEFLASQNLSINSPPEVLIKSLQHIQDMANKALQPSQSLPKKLSATTLEMSDIHHRLGVIHKNSGPRCQWSLVPTSGQDRPNGTAWLHTVLQDFETDELWGLESCEAMVRTVVDLIIFDRLKLLDRGSPTPMVRIIRECQIDTRTIDPAVVISGRCDYVIGYGGSLPGGKDLDYGLVAIEIKGRYQLLLHSPQLISYLVGIQQQRQAVEKTVPVVYGIATDGVNFCFHRLDHQRRLKTKFVFGSDKQLVYRYIDIILESAVRASSSLPHTNPAAALPDFLEPA